MAIQNFNVGVKAAIIQDGKILLVKHATKGFWDVPGGRIDGDESIEETLRRELQEELPNIQLQNIGKIICAYRVPDFAFDDGSGLLLIVHDVAADFPNGIPEISDEHSEAKWVTFDEALEIGSHIVKEMVNTLIKA